MMKEEEIMKLAEDYIDSCTKKSGFVILAEGLKRDFIDLFVAGFMKCLEINKPNEWHYIKNGDYPRDKKTVLALCIVGGEPYPYLAQYWKGSTTAKKNGVDLNWSCWLNNMQREVVEPYAWREITIPELGLQLPMQEG